MKKVGFVGAYDKIETLLYVAKLLRFFNQRVLVIDSCKMQKARYIIPAVAPTVNYITTFEGFDVAVGFDNWPQLKGYLGKTVDENLDYDVVLVDVDSIEHFENFEIEQAENLFFATGFDLYSLRKGLDILCRLAQPIPMTKMLFANKILPQDNEYLNFLAQNTKVIWNEEVVGILTSDSDNFVFAENQRVAKLKYKNLSPSFKESLAIIVVTILQNVRISDVTKVIKTIDKGV